METKIISSFAKLRFFYSLIFSRRKTMSENEIEFLIEPGAQKQVEKTKTLPAWMFFSLGSFRPNKDLFTATVDGFTAQFKKTGPCGYSGETENKLYIDRFGYFGGKGYGREDMIDRALAKNDEATIKKAFTKLARKILQGGHAIPPTAINLLDPDSETPQEKLPAEPAWFEIQPTSTITETEQVQELDDLYFNVEQATIPEGQKRIKVQVDNLKLISDGNAHPRYVKAEFDCCAKLHINHLGWFSESPNALVCTDKAITDMRKYHSDETIEKAFRQLGAKLLERVKNDSSKKRKAPPANPRVWTSDIGDDNEEKAESGKRVKRTPPEAKSD